VLEVVKGSVAGAVRVEPPDRVVNTKAGPQGYDGDTMKRGRAGIRGGRR